MTERPRRWGRPRWHEPGRSRAEQGPVLGVTSSRCQWCESVKLCHREEGRGRRLYAAGEALPLRGRMWPTPLCKKVVLARLLPTVRGGTGQRSSSGQVELGAASKLEAGGTEKRVTEQRRKLWKKGERLGSAVFSEPSSSESRGYILVWGMALLIAGEPSSSKNHMAPVRSAHSCNQTAPNIRLLYFWSLLC
jgi:hypothetical protein